MRWVAEHERTDVKTIRWRVVTAYFTGGGSIALLGGELTLGSSLAAGFGLVAAPLEVGAGLSYIAQQDELGDAFTTASGLANVPALGVGAVQLGRAAGPAAQRWLV